MCFCVMCNSITETITTDNGENLQARCENCGFLLSMKPVELMDISKTGKKRLWSKYKSESVLLSESFERLKYHKRARAIVECGSELEFKVCPDGHYKKLVWANFCKVRLCTMCGWRRSLKVAHQVKQVAHEAVKKENMRWLFLTLTIKNVGDKELKTTLDHLSKSFRRMFLRKRFKTSILGFFRSLEVTYNKKENTYHPHYHILLSVRSNYFTCSYINKREWTELWRNAANLDYQPIVDIRILKPKKNVDKEVEILTKKGYLNAGVISEISKYTVKSSHYLFKDNFELTDKVVYTLCKALRGKRLFAFGGIMKQVCKELEKEKKTEDIESDNVNLINISDDLKECTCPTCNSTLLEEIYHWLPDLNGYYKK